MEQNRFPNPPQGWQQPGMPANMPPAPMHAPYGQPQMQMPPMPNQPGQPPINNFPQNGKKPAKKSKGKWITLGIFGLIGLVIGVIVLVIVNKYAKQMTVVQLPGAPIIADTGIQGTDVDGDGTIDIPVDTDSIDLTQITTNEHETWDGNSRITCLAMGLDYRDWIANDGAPRSDSMMLLTYDPVTKWAGMLSIPRDTWVAIPNHGYGRINTAYSLGEGEQLPGVNGRPGGGAGLAMQTVELFLGVEIQYYAVIDFNGFVDFIDAIDKLAINVRNDIDIGSDGNGNIQHLMAGVQDLDGRTALAYARYRYTEGGDFERAQRQQDVLFALFEQMKWQLPELLTTKFDTIFACIQKAIKTNVPTSDMLKLAWTVTEINPYMIKRAVIAPPDQVLYDTSEDGQQILIPIPDKIREARDIIFSNSISAASADDDFSEADRIRNEGARVVLLNGSTVGGLAEQTAQYLQGFGIQITSIGGGTASYCNTMQIKNGKPYTAKFLKDLMSIPTEAITMNYEPGGDADIILNITDAWAQNNTM